MAYTVYQYGNSGIHFSKFLLLMAVCSICLEVSRKEFGRHRSQTTEDTVLAEGTDTGPCQCGQQCRHCAWQDLLLVKNDTNTSYSNSSSYRRTIELHDLFRSNEKTHDTDLLSYFVLFSTTTCVGTSSYFFGVVYVQVYNNIQTVQLWKQSIPKTLIIWCGVPVGFHALYMSTLIVTNQFFLTNSFQWYIVSFIATCFLIATNLILLLSLTSKVFKDNNVEIENNGDKEIMQSITSAGNEETTLLQNENISKNPIAGNNLSDQITPFVPLFQQAHTELLSEEYNQLLQTLLEESQRLYDNDYSCHDPSHLKIWCRAFANSLNEDVDVHFDRTLFKTAKKFEINLYSSDKNNFEKRCKEHHQKLRVVTFKFAYEAMEGWQKHGTDFPLEESRSLILNVASRWMAVVQEWVAKEETKGADQDMGPDDEQKAWFKKAVARQQELSLNGEQEGPGSKLMFDKWILIGLTFGSLGGKMMKGLIKQSV